MQDILNNTGVVIIVASAVVVVFAIGYLSIIIAGNKRIIEEHKAKLEAVQKSEQRYKALFENSEAGMMKFNFTTWDVMEANEAILTMFNCTTAGALQNKLMELPDMDRRRITVSLANTGTLEGFEIEFDPSKKIKRQFLLSARREKNENIAHAVVVFVSAERKIG